MLYMVVNTHNPESCAFRGEAEDRALSGALERFEQGGPEAQMTLKGSWINRSGHEFFLLVDAPNAHVVEDELVGAGLVGLTHSRVLPILPASDVNVPA